MSIRIFSTHELALLRANSHVESCTERYINYSKAFKLQAVEQYSNQGKGSKEIFINAGFNLDLIGHNTPKSCLVRWNRTLRLKGMEKLAKETRGRNGGRIKPTFKTDKEKLEYLETKVKYLEAENRFLAQLRKVRRTE